MYRDIAPIHALVTAHVGHGRLLGRSVDDIAATLPLWIVAVHHQTVVGCGTLVALSPTLVEIRSLVVDPAYRGAGLGTQLITRLITRAATLGAHRILALTCAVPVFTRCGFTVADTAAFPEKVARDCVPCPLRRQCPETAVVLTLEQPPARDAFLLPETLR